MAKDAIAPSAVTARSKRPVLIAIILLLSVYSIGETVPTLWEPWHPRGDYGFSVDEYDRVQGVKPGSAAATAGMAVGDVLDFARTNLRERELIGSFPFPGTALSVTVTRAGRPLAFTMKARPMAWSPVENFGFILGVVCSAIIVMIGAGLALLRPSRMTFFFFLYCMWFTPGELAVFYDLLSPVEKVVQGLTISTLLPAGYCGLLAFALLFPSDRVGSWRKWAYFALPLIFLTWVSLNYYSLIVGFVLNRPLWPSQKLIDNAGFWLEAAVYVAALIAFLDTYVHARADARQRIKWVMAAFIIAVGVFIIADATPFFSAFAPDWAYAFIYLPGVAAPLAVAYAVIRHRVIDVNFVISRTLAYGGLIAALIGLLLLIDVLLTKLLAGTQLQIAIDIAIATAIGFSFNTVHERLFSFVDRIFFHQRHDARVRLRAIRDELPTIDSAHDFDRLVTVRVAEALDIDSAAVFHRDSDGAYTREATVGWPAGMAWHLLPSDKLLGKLTSNPKIFRIHDDLEAASLPGGTARPGIALPFVLRRRVGVIVLYGAHRSGADLDSEEMRELSSFASDAALTFDSLTPAPLAGGAPRGAG